MSKSKWFLDCERKKKKINIVKFLTISRYKWFVPIFVKNYNRFKLHILFFLCRLWIVMLITSLTFIHWTFWNIVALIQVTGESEENSWFSILKTQNVARYHTPLWTENKHIFKNTLTKISFMHVKSLRLKNNLKAFKLWALLKGFHEIKWPAILPSVLAVVHWFSTCGVEGALKERLQEQVLSLQSDLACLEVFQTIQLS